MEESISKEIIRGHTATIILNILSQGDSYGYEIYKHILVLSENRYELKEATLYTVFKRLEKEGSIESYWGDETQGGRRKYYRITDSGKRVLEEHRRSWRFAKEIIEILINGEIKENE
ncbi:PadR family transcriptional regulator [Rummeliibacillus suwonensis]|jgi:transcriptional regulator, PadR family|uniref:PadR family transcriptional regulator n=1 Tax=Rummeliibacillus suwonensis TaxID=1306154 RepID=UPI0011B3B261|nr:PadR family transcriptional regulator [Rummeliibacillus suwonensis]